MKVTKVVCDECRAEITLGDQSFCIWIQGDSLAIEPANFNTPDDYPNGDEAKHICGISCSTRVVNAWLEKRMQRKRDAAAA